MRTSASRHAYSDGSIAPLREDLAELRAGVSAGMHDLSTDGRRVARAAKTLAHDTASGIMEAGSKVGTRLADSITRRPLTSIAIATAVGAAVVVGMTWWLRSSSRHV